MVLRLDNSNGIGRRLSCMDCSRISRYPEEDERYMYIVILQHTHSTSFVIIHSIFLADMYSINISSIQLMSTCTNYEQIISAITSFDSIVSDNIDWIHKPSSSFLAKLLKVLDHLLFFQDKDKFIYQTFQFFAQSKQYLQLDLSDLYYNMTDSKFLGLTFDGDGLTKREYDNDNHNHIIYDDNTNLMKKEIFDIFLNAKEIRLDYVQNKNNYWSFSLLKLLESIGKTNIEEVRVGTLKEEDPSSWLVSLWSSSSPSLIQAFKNEGYTVEFQTFGDDHSILIKKL